MKKKKSEFQPLGQWIAVKTDKKGKETTTEHGVIYTDKYVGRYVKSEVLMVGSGVVEDIKPGNIVYWDSKEYKQGNEVDDMHIIHEKWIAVVEDED